MRNAEKVLFFILIFIISVFIFIFILFFFSKDIPPKAYNIQSNVTNLSLNVRRDENQLLVSADGNSRDFFAHWFIEADPDRSGAVTIRSAYNGNYIYPTADGFFTVNLTARQGTEVDPVGWFYIRSGTSTGTILFQSFEDPSLYITIAENRTFQLIQLSTNISRAEFRLVGIQ